MKIYCEYVIVVSYLSFSIVLISENISLYYVALRIGEDGEYILNGNFMVMHRKVIVHPGVTIEYSGPESVVERLNSSRPIVIDLILEAGSPFTFYNCVT